MAKEDTDTQLTIKQLQWLLERMNAKTDPITRKLVEAFGRHPAGPILPPECLAVERLSDNCGTRRTEQLMLNFGDPVHDLAVSPHGELWIAEVIDGVSMLENRGTPEGKRLRGITHIGLLADEEMGTLFSPRILGFKPDDTPVTFLKKVASCPDSAYRDDDAIIFISGRRAFELQLPKRRLIASHVTPDGCLLTSHDVSGEHEAHEAYRNGELLFCTELRISGIWEFGDRILFSLGFHELFMRSVSGSESSKGAERLVNNEDVRDVFMRDGALHYITRGHDGQCAIIYKITEETTGLGTRRVCVVHAFRGHAYFRGYTELPDGRIAYIGETARDRHECWVVDGVAGPGFDHVTGLLIREGQPRYWGSLGRHLYTMELPST